MSFNMMEPLSHSCNSARVHLSNRWIPWKHPAPQTWRFCPEGVFDAHNDGVRASAPREVLLLPALVYVYIKSICLIYAQTISSPGC